MAIAWKRDKKPLNHSGTDEFEAMARLDDGRAVSLRLFAPKPGYHSGWEWSLYFDTGEAGPRMSEDARVEGECESRDEAEACVARGLAAMRQIRRHGVIDPDAIERAAKGGDRS